MIEFKITYLIIILMNILIGKCYNSIQTIRVNVKPFFFLINFIIGNRC